MITSKLQFYKTQCADSDSIEERQEKGNFPCGQSLDQDLSQCIFSAQTDSFEETQEKETFPLVGL